jgi:uncharacterized protein
MASSVETLRKTGYRPADNKTLLELLLRSVPTDPSSVIQKLEAHPDVAPMGDFFGYTLLHAAASYSQGELARLLVRQYAVSTETVDEDGDSPLFYAESVDMARLLIEELGADAGWRNHDGDTFVQVLQRNVEEGDVEGWELDMLSYIDSLNGRSKSAEEPGKSEEADTSEQETQTDSVADTPAASADVSSTVASSSSSAQPRQGDFESTFRTRIEALTVRDDLNSATGQAEVRGLAQELLSQLKGEQQQRQQEPDEEDDADGPRSKRLAT